MMKGSVAAEGIRPLLLRRSASGQLAAHTHVRTWMRADTGEPPVIALVKKLLNPFLVVCTLVLCTLILGRSFTWHYRVLAVLAFVVAVQVMDRPRLHQRDSDDLWWRDTRRIFFDWACTVALLLLLGFMFKVSSIFSRTVILTWFAVTPLVLVGAHLATRKLMGWLVRRGTIARRQVIVGANELGCELACRLAEEPCSGTVQGFFDDRQIERLHGVCSQQLLGRFGDLAEYVRRHAIHAIYICLPISAQPRIRALLEDLRDTTASIYFVPDVFAFDLIQARFGEIRGMPLLAICETPFCGMNGVLKRVCDIVLAAAGLVLAAPLLIAIIVGVKRSSPGPVLFRQRRYGLDGEEFLVYKFRTMTVCEDGGDLRQASRDDQRTTRFGGFLRRTSLDELPQLINVLEGKMSLVGPRPHAVAHNEHYRKLVSGYMLRHKVRPGMTGWAQVNGLRGETTDLERMHTRVQFDLDYLKNWSLGLDLRILLMTAVIVLRDRNAY